MKIDLKRALQLGIDPEAAEGFIEHRKGLKKPLTRRAFNQLMDAAYKCEEKGICSATEAVDITCIQGWCAIKPEWIERTRERTRGLSASHLSLQDDLNDHSWVN